MITSSVSAVDILTFVVAILLPLLNGFLTSRQWAPATKGIALAALAFVFGILSELLDALVAEVPYDIGMAALRFGGIFIVAVVSYFGVLSRPLERGGSESLASKVASRGVK